MSKITKEPTESDWIEIFRAGTHIDSAGKEHTYHESDLLRIADKFNGLPPELKKAPLVKGHPKDNDPAFGWVARLKAAGKSLYMKAKEVQQRFIEEVNSGMFKHRSISLYPDGTLRHVGYLGAVQPAIKGMADHKFNEYCFMELPDEIFTDFEEEPAQTAKYDDFLTQVEEQLGKENTAIVQQIAIDTNLIKLPNQDNNSPSKDTNQETEFMAKDNEKPDVKVDNKPDAKPVDYAEIIALEVKKAKDEMETSFNEKMDAKDAEIKALTDRANQMETKARLVEFNSYFNEQVAAKKLLPKQRDDVMFLLNMANKAGTYNFSDADGNEKQGQAIDKVKGFIESFGEVWSDAEVAKNGKTPPAQSYEELAPNEVVEDDDAELDAKAEKIRSDYREKHGKELSYDDALDMALKQ